MKYFPLLLLWSTIVFAEETIHISKPVNLGQLATEAHALVPDLAVTHQDEASNTLHFNRTTGDFSPQERVLLQQAIDAHDATKEENQNNQQKINRVKAEQKLKALGLSEDELKALGL